MGAGNTLSGTVIEFDEHRGLGRIEASDSGDHHVFHCIEIADGTRSVDVGQPVTFGLLARFGSRQACQVRKSAP